MCKFKKNMSSHLKLVVGCVQDRPHNLGILSSSTCRLLLSDFSLNEHKVAAVVPGITSSHNNVQNSTREINVIFEHIFKNEEKFPGASEKIALHVSLNYAQD